MFTNAKVKLKNSEKKNKTKNSESIKDRGYKISNMWQDKQKTLQRSNKRL